MDLSTGSPVRGDMDDLTVDDTTLIGGTAGRSKPDGCGIPEDTSPKDDQRKSRNPALAPVGSRSSTTSQRDDDGESASACCSVDTGGRTISMVHAWHPEGGNGRDSPDATVRAEAVSAGTGEHDEGSRVEQQFHAPKIHKPIQYRCLPAAPPVGQIPHYSYQRQMSSTSVVQGPGPSRGFRSHHPIEQFQQRQAPPSHYVYPPYAHVAPTVVPTVHTQKPPQPEVLTLRQRSASDKGCSCSKTQCLKLYCSCFANNLLCNKDVCICSDCKNCEAESAEGMFCLHR